MSETQVEIDKRNIVDKYKFVSNELIKKDVKENSYPFSVCMMHLTHDFNISSILRHANALGACEAYYFGSRKKYDKRGATGTYNYTDMIHVKEFNDLYSLKEIYTFVALENNINRKVESLKSFDWPDNAMIIIGEEACGVPDQVLDICDFFIEIPMRGSVRSMNAASAASVAMWDLVSKKYIK